MSSLRSSSNSNGNDAGSGTANGGIRSIREMFEKGGGSGASNAGSLSPRGLSPADSVNGGERPVRKVRTSFVAVEPSGLVDVGGADTGVAVNGKEKEGVEGSKDGTLVKDTSGTYKKGNSEETDNNVVDREKGMSNVPGANQVTSNAKLKAELDQALAKSVVNGSGGQKNAGGIGTSEDTSKSQFTLVDEKKEATDKTPTAKNQNTSHHSPSVNDSGLNGKSVTKTPTKQSATSKNASPVKSGLKKTNAINKDNGKGETSHKSPISTPKRSKAASLVKMSDAAPSPRNVALPKSPNSPKSVTKTAQGTHDSPTNNKSSSAANAKSRVSSIGGVPKASGSSTNKATVKPPVAKTDGAGTTKKDTPSTRKLSVSAAGSQKEANSKKKRTSLPQAIGTAAKLSGTVGSARASIGATSATSMKKSDPAKVSASQSSLKSPKRSVPLSTHLTAPTASSNAKHGSQSSQSQPKSFASSTSAAGRKPSTSLRDTNSGTVKSTVASARKAPSAGAPASSILASSSAKPASNIKKVPDTSTTAVSKRQSLRASLPAVSSRNTDKTASSQADSSANASTVSRSAQASSVRSPGNSFLDRMMRPTTSFASKAHEKIDVKSPPRRSASVRTRPKPAIGGTDKSASGATNTGPVSRTRALQDALIGSKGRKQTGMAAARKITPDTNSTLSTKREGGEGKEGDGMVNANRHITATDAESSKRQPVATKKDEQDDLTSSKHTKEMSDGVVADDSEQTFSPETKTEAKPAGKEEAKLDDTSKAEPEPGIKPEQDDHDGAQTQAGDGPSKSIQVNGDSKGIVNGDSTADRNGNVAGDESKEGKLNGTNNAKPEIEQAKHTEEADDQNTATNTSTDATIADPFTVPTPQFDRTVIR